MNTNNRSAAMRIQQITSPRSLRTQQPHLGSSFIGSLCLAILFVFQLSNQLHAQQKNLLEQLDKQLGQPDSPARVRELMLQAGERIRNGKTNAETLQLQTSAIRSIEQWLEQTKKQQQQQRGEQTRVEPQANAGQSEQPMEQPGDKDNQGKKDDGEQQPASDGGKRSGSQSGNTPTSVAGKGQEAESPDLPVKDLAKGVWGHLPERVRRQLDAVSSEQFLPAYRELIENYYRRLAEQQRESSR